MRSVTAVLLAAILAIPVAACSGQDSTDTVPDSSPTTTTSVPTTTTNPMPPGRPVVIDTDMGVEGMMSLLYLIGQEDLDVLAITVSGTGLVHCEQGVDQVLGLLDLVDAPEIPVACGAETPIDGINAFPTSYRVAADSGYGLDLPTSRSAAEVDAPTLIVSTITTSPEPVTVYADGPETNLASALRIDPTIADNIEMAYIMGGAIDVPGNTSRNERAEWNIWVDPVAADEVLRSGMPITLVPLDATNQVPLHVFHLRALQAHEGTSAALAVVTVLNGNEALHTGGLFFWDQLTAALLVDESYGTSTTQNIEVVLDDNRSVAGITLEAETGSVVRVVESVDRNRFETEFLSAIAGEDVGPIVVDPDWRVVFDGMTWSSDAPDLVGGREYVVLLSNEGEGDAGVAVAWLIEDATVEDMDAWDTIAQPPFIELESFTYMAPGSETVTTMSLSGAHEYVVVGLDIEGDDPTTLASVDLTG